MEGRGNVMELFSRRISSMVAPPALAVVVGKFQLNGSLKCQLDPRRNGIKIEDGAPRLAWSLMLMESMRRQ